jgi:hypothetical protein
LFTAAGNTLLQGLLEPEEVQDCFKKLETRVSFGGISGMDALDTKKLDVRYDFLSQCSRLDLTFRQEFREIHAAWLQRRNEEEQRSVTAAEVPMEEVETPVASATQDLPATNIDVDTPSSALQELEPLSLFQDVEFCPDTVTDIRASTVSSPTLSISTVSDLTPTELGEIEEDDGEHVSIRHETFYLEDGNVEIVCGHTIFRVHSP